MTHVILNFCHHIWFWKLLNCFFSLLGWMCLCVCLVSSKQQKKWGIWNEQKKNNDHYTQYNRKWRKKMWKKDERSTRSRSSVFYSKFFTISKSFTPFIWCVVRQKKKETTINVLRIHCTQHTVTICSCSTITSLSHGIALKYSTTTTTATLNQIDCRKKKKHVELSGKKNEKIKIIIALCTEFWKRVLVRTKQPKTTTTTRKVRTWSFKLKINNLFGLVRLPLLWA